MGVVLTPIGSVFKAMDRGDVTSALAIEMVRSSDLRNREKADIVSIIDIRAERLRQAAALEKRALDSGDEP